MVCAWGTFLPPWISAGTFIVLVFVTEIVSGFSQPKDVSPNYVIDYDYDIIDLDADNQGSKTIGERTINDETINAKTISGKTIADHHDLLAKNVHLKTHEDSLLRPGQSNDIVVDDDDIYTSGSGSGDSEPTDVPPLLLQTTMPRDYSRVNSEHRQKSHIDLLEESLAHLDQTFIDNEDNDGSYDIEDNYTEEEKVSIDGKGNGAKVGASSEMVVEKGNSRGHWPDNGAGGRQGQTTADHGRRDAREDTSRVTSGQVWDSAAEALEANVPQACLFSLFDSVRQKFLYTNWNETTLTSRAKVSKWCERRTGHFFVMVTPEPRCQEVYTQLCKVSSRCRAKDVVRERGDFAEGCWRDHALGEMLPQGLSSRQKIAYFICQRFSPESVLGKRFGVKTTHFGTLYDTTLRSAVFSLVRMDTVGDERWPITDYFIEHDLVEKEGIMRWFSLRPKKGIVMLPDLDRCQYDQDCDLGLRQVLPSDYSLEPSDYVPIHLMWPEWLPLDPGPRLASFTLTNMVPLRRSLVREWHKTAKQIRQFAIEVCGVPLVTDVYSERLSSHRVSKSTLYLTSGITPSTDPPLSTARGVHVPATVWAAGCCITRLTSQGQGETNPPGNDVYGSVDEKVLNITVSIKSFAVSLKNEVSSHVTALPVTRLEQQLQEHFRLTASDPDVVLFPGNEGACGRLENDASAWFRSRRSA